MIVKKVSKSKTLKKKKKDFIAVGKWESEEIKMNVENVSLFYFTLAEPKM